MAEAARLSRGPDIILRTAPPLSTTNDAPLAPVPQPPESASNDQADIERGVDTEMSPEAQAEARRAATVDPEAESANDNKAKTDDKTAEDKKAADLDDISTVQVDGKDVPIPPWMKREITKSRNRQREAEAKAKELADSSTAATERLAKLEAELADLRAKAANTNATNDNQETVEQPAADTRPTRDQFDDPDAYDEALAGWAEREGVRKAEAKAQTERAEAEKAAREASEKAEQEAAAAAAVELNARWTTRVEQFKEIHDDFEAVTTADDVSISPIMANGILRLENGPEVAYHLGQNKDEAARIAKLDPMTQLIELGALSRHLRTPAQRGPRPRPLEPIDAASNVADSSDREETMEEVAARVNARYARERKPFVQVTTR